MIIFIHTLYTYALNDYVIFHVYRLFFWVRSSISSDRKREAKAHGLLQLLYFGMYPELTGMEGPTDDTDPKDNSALDFLKPSAVCELIATETKRVRFTGDKQGKNQEYL